MVPFFKNTRFLNNSNKQRFFTMSPNVCCLNDCYPEIFQGEPNFSTPTTLRGWSKGVSQLSPTRTVNADANITIYDTQ